MKSIFEQFPKIQKLLSKRVVIAVFALTSVFILSIVTLTGYFVWSAGSYAVSKVHENLPMSLPSNLNSTVQKIQDAPWFEACRKIAFDLFTVEPWLTQPIGVNLDKLKTACWPTETSEKKKEGVT